jgi:hypothetical protein
MPAFNLQTVSRQTPSLRLAAPLGFIDSGSDVGEKLAEGSVTAAAGAIVFLFQSLRELDRQRRQRPSPSPFLPWEFGQPREKTLVEERPQCRAEDAAEAYLKNLQRDGIDHALRSIPPRTYDWKLPTGHGVEVKQAVGKDGLVFDITLVEPQGKRYRLQSVRAEVSEKGIKLPVGRFPLRAGGLAMGELDVALRVNAGGLDEVTLSHTGTAGRVMTVKLKTKPCDPELTPSDMVRKNIGSSADARRWSEAHLAKSAQVRRGNLHEGLTDLLMQIQPSANGIYRNHGSASLALLSRPLELLRTTGADLSGLHAIQHDYAALPRQADGRPTDVQAFRAMRQQAWVWLQQSLSSAIDRGQISARDLANRFGVNYGLDEVRAAETTAAASRARSAARVPDAQPYAVGEGIGTPFGRALWAGRSASGDGIVRTRTTSYVVPANTVDLGNRDAVRAWVLRSVEHRHINPDQLYGASQARYLDGERIGTPHGDLVFDVSGRAGVAYVRGRDKAYRIKTGVDLGNRDAVRAWVIRAIEHGQIDRAELLDAPAAKTARDAHGGWPVKVRTRMREVQQSVRALGWEVTQLSDGKLFVWRVAGEAAPAAVTRAVAATLKVPADKILASAHSQIVLGQSRSGLALSARVFAD